MKTEERIIELLSKHLALFEQAFVTSKSDKDLIRPTIEFRQALKALINEARIEELNTILDFPPRTLTLFKKSIKARIRALRRLTNND